MLLAGEFFVPAQPSSTKARKILVVPGGSAARVGNNRLVGLRGIASELAENGFSTFLYEGRGFGKSEGVKLRQSESVLDFRGAMNFLENPEVWGSGDNHISVLAFSAGGAAVLDVAGDYPVIKNILCYATLPSYVRSKEDGRTQAILEYYYKESKSSLSYEGFVKQYNPLIPVEYNSKIEVPILLAGGSEDNSFFRLDEQEELAASLQKSQSVCISTIKGWNHSLDMDLPDFKSVVKEFSKWFLDPEQVPFLHGSNMTAGKANS